jgi:hypothetical protein
MKEHCGGLIVIMLSLGAIVKVNADIEFHGVWQPKTLVVEMDSVQLMAPDTFFLTPGWGSHPPLDTHDFAGVAAWPETIELHGTIAGIPMRQKIRSPKPDSWYRIGMGVVVPEVMFYGTGYGSIEQPKPAAARLFRLAVGPSVVTRQMTVKLQPVSTGRPIVEMYDATGNVVRSLDCTSGTDGAATATWNREDEFGRLVPEGVYFCRYAASDVIAVRKVLVAR